MTTKSTVVIISLEKKKRKDLFACSPSINYIPHQHQQTTMTAKKPEPQEPMTRVSGKDWKMAKTATRRSQMPNALKQTYAERMAKTKQLNIARDMAKSMKQEKIDDKRVS